MNIRTYLSGAALFVAGVMHTPTLSAAPSGAGGPSDEEVEKSLAGCLRACAKKTGTHACVNPLDELKACPTSNIAECQGVMTPEEGASVAALCEACGHQEAVCQAEASVARTNPAPSKPSQADAANETKKPKKRRHVLTPEQVCTYKKRGVWVTEPVIDEDGDNTGETTSRCFTLENAHAWLSELEQAVRKQRSKTVKKPLTEQEVTALRRILQVQNMGSEDRERLADLTKALGALCPPLKNDPHATMEDRCTSAFNAQDDTNRRVEARANSAYEMAELAHRRIADIETGHKPIGTLRTILHFSAVGTLHLYRTEERELPWLAGFEVQWFPRLTPDLSLTFLGGGGTGNDHIAGQHPLGLWFGFGLAGPMFTDDLLAEGIVYMEHWLTGREESGLNFYGVGPGIIWTPGASSRRTVDLTWVEKEKVRPQATLVPQVGIRSLFGSRRMPGQNEEVSAKFAPLVSIFGGVGF